MCLCCYWTKEFNSCTSCWKITSRWSNGLYMCCFCRSEWTCTNSIYCTICWMCNCWTLVRWRKRCFNCLWWFIETCGSLSYNVVIIKKTTRTWSLSRGCLLFTFKITWTCLPFKWRKWWRINYCFTNHWNTSWGYFSIYSNKRNLNYWWTNLLTTRIVQLWI